MLCGCITSCATVCAAPEDPRGKNCTSARLAVGPGLNGWGVRVSAFQELSRGNRSDPAAVGIVASTAEHGRDAKTSCSIRSIISKSVRPYWCLVPLHIRLVALDPSVSLQTQQQHGGAISSAAGHAAVNALPRLLQPVCSRSQLQMGPTAASRLPTTLCQQHTARGTASSAAGGLEQ
jgi:hypothetical protein